jgi:hypothetical protein
MTIIISGDTGVPVSPVTGTLAVANGGTGVTASKILLQNLNFQTGAVATGTTLIPYDDTIPQITEGDQYMSLAITPTSATSVLEITVLVNAARSVLSTHVIALFRDAVSNALAVTQIIASAGYTNSNELIHRMTSGTTSEITFRVRLGGDAAGTHTFNGSGGSRYYGGTYASSITIKEYTA